MGKNEVQTLISVIRTFYSLHFVDDKFKNLSFLRIHLCVFNLTHNIPRKRTIFVMWQRVHYIISTVPCAKLLTSIKRTLIHLIVILNGVYIARMANIYINIVKEATSHERGGDSACFFFQWLIDTPPKACSIKTRARLKRNWLSVNVCLNGFISQTDKGYANSPARRCPILEPPMPNPSNAKC